MSDLKLAVIRRNVVERKRPAILLVVIVAGFVATLTTTTGRPPDEITAAPSNDIAFMGTTVDGQPLSWDACNPISWTFNTGGVPQEIIDITHEAIATMEATSGFDFAFVEYTDSLHPHGMRADPPAANLHIEIVPDQQSDVLAMGDWGATDLRHEGGAITGAVVALNADGIGHHGTDSGPGSWQSLVVHELGHVVGLGHSTDPNDLMHPNWNKTPGVLSADDIHGLRFLRDRSDC